MSASTAAPDVPRRSDPGTGNAPLRAISVGATARAALARGGGLAVPAAPFADSPYFLADGEIIWVGARLPAPHPRAVVTASPAPRGVALRFEALPRTGWNPRLPALDATSAARVVAGTGDLRRALARAATPRGFGAILAGMTPPFPLDLAAAHVSALADAYRRDDARAAVAASSALLGFGTGLTPSGDDLAGAALFARKLVAAGNASWSQAAERLCREVTARSHAVSAALFRDLARGQSFAPLHALAEALARGDAAGALVAAQSAAAIGHSSGWDMLTGFVVGTGAALD